MLSDADIDALDQARHSDPFAVLGLHRDDAGRWWMRACLPAARAAWLVDARSGDVVCELPRRRGPVFEVQVPGATARFAYRLKVQWDGGHEGDIGDPYAHGPQIAEADLYYLGEGRHQRPYAVLGAHPTTVGDGVGAATGVRFAVWAPNASRVSVVGNFNGWDGRRHPMRSRGASGIWELFIPDVMPGDLYKFELRARDGRILPLKCDPYARQSQLRPETASVVPAPLGPPRPLPAGRGAANARSAPMSVYEVHAGSWRRHPDGRHHSWDEMAAALPGYAAELGFTHIQLMPVSEYPFDGSWGYQTLGLYAPTARFGPPEGFHRFVKACHDAGLGVLVDWVPAHFPTDAHGLVQFDGTALYEYGDPREGFHRDWNTLIYNFGRTEVRNFLTGSALYWCEQMGVDGLRVDAVASMLYRDYSRPEGQWVPNQYGGRENLEAIAMMRQANEVIGAEVPGAITVAEESTAFPGVSAPTSAGGLGFHYKWNMGWMHDTLAYMQEDPVNRAWHHDKLTFGLVYAYTENFVLPLSHDEVVHGKGSILGRMPGDNWQRFANLRAYYGYMWAHPGKKLLFMGQEFAQLGEWNHNVELPWGLLGDSSHAGVQRLVRDLNRLYRDAPALHAKDCEPSGFEWIDTQDRQRSVLSWMRRDGAGDLVIVVCNFTPVVRQDYVVGIPDDVPDTAWCEVLNTDSQHYGGSNVGNGSQPMAALDEPANGRRRSLRVTLPPLATLMLRPC